jgi:hypothetical protein
MEIYCFIGNLPSSQIVTIILEKGNLKTKWKRTSILSYIWPHNNYYYVYLDEMSKNSELYSGIKEVIHSRGDTYIEEHPLEDAPNIYVRMP